MRKGAAWIAATRLVMSLLGLASMLILARILTPADFGLVAIAMTASQIVLALTELSLSQALVQHRNPLEVHYHTAFTLNLLRAAIVALIVIAISGPAATFYGEPRLAPLLVVVGASTLVTGLINPKLVVFSRNLVFWQDFVLRGSDKAVGFVVALVVAFVWRSYWALVIGVIAGQFTSLILSYVLIPYRPNVRLSEWRGLMSFSVWLTLGQAVNTLNWRLDQLVVGYLLGSAQLGYYTVGDRLAVLPTREVTAPLVQAAFPGFTKLVDDPDRLRRGYQRVQSVLTAAALPIGVGFAVVAEPLVLLAMGPEWRPAAIVIQFLASIFAIQTLASTVQPLALALGETRVLFWRSLITLSIRVPLIIAGLIMGGLVGLLWARCASGIIAIWINMILVRQLAGLSVREQIAVNIRSLVSVAIMALSVYLIGYAFGLNEAEVSLFAKACAMIAGGVVIYPAVLWLLWRLAGYPQGPEHEGMAVIWRVLAIIRRKPSKTA